MSDKNDSKENRYNIIDIIKGIGIILVVMGHSGSPFGNFIYLFHMSLFFVCSGFCYREGKYSTKEYLRNKIKNLYFPCLLSNLFFLLLNNFLVNINFLSLDEKKSVHDYVTSLIKVIFFGGGCNSLVVVNWFFRALFFASLIYDILNRILRKIFNNKPQRETLMYIYRTCVCLMMCVLHWLIIKIGLLSSNYFNFAFLICFFDFGQIIYLVSNLKSTSTKISFAKHVNVFLVCMSIVLLWFLSKWRIELIDNQIVNPLFFVVSGVMGVYLIYLVATWIKDMKCNYGNYIRGGLKFLGVNSIYIMVFHLISFKCVTLIGRLLFKNYDVFQLHNTYPHRSYIVWAAYTIVGVSVPMLILLMKNKAKSLVR